MLAQIKELLSSAQLQQKVQQATHLGEAINLIVTAGAEKGYNFTNEVVSQALAALTSIESNELSEEDLLAVSGGYKETYRYWCQTDEGCL